ncbi:MAG: M60 family metallopeptidase [Clostridia bacterium]|nr:M60 family metallopeptidase [Clostridia bacterium]
MAEKKTTTANTKQSKTAAQPKTAKPAAKPATTAKTTASVKPVAKSATAAKPAATTKQPVTKTTDTKQSKPAAKPVAKTATTAKPAAKPATAAKTTATAKPATTAKPAAKPTVTEKPAASKQSKTAEQPKAAAATANKPAKTKTAKTSKQSKTSKSGGAVALTKKQIHLILISAAALILVLAIVIGSALGAKACKNAARKGYLSNVVIQTPTSGQYNLSTSVKPTAKYENITVGEENYYNEADINTFTYDRKYLTNTAVGYYGEVIGTVKRNIPKNTRDEGLGVYPKYGYTLNTVIGSDKGKVAARDALGTESAYLAAWGTAGANRGGEETADKYTWIDKDGLLYRGTRGEPVQSLDKSGKQRKLYKHTASVGLYMGNVSDEEPGIIKRVTMRPRGYSSYGVTGVYAPAGEVLKIQLSEADMNATGGLTIHIGQALYNGQANNIWTGKNQMQRIPHLLTTLEVNKNTAVLEDGVWTAYVGSFLGGPLYIRHESSTFTATISGGVAYQHFILGYTSQEEFAENAKSTAPYFDLEVWHSGVLHSGPINYAKNYSYDQLYNAAVLWDKVASTTAYGSGGGIVFLYDPFVAAGAAVAFPGRNSVNCPLGWMKDSLNYNGIVTSGSWGNFHEYHHNFQNFGVGYTGEVTNNALTLVSYSLFTKISAKRGITSFGAQGLSGWNTYTSATWALNRVNTEQISSTNGLAVYATLLHNLGPDAFLKSRSASGAAYFNKWANNTHQDFTYYASKIGAYTGDVVVPAETDYPTFVPVSSVYQTGRSYTYDSEKRYIQTMQPYVIPYGEPFTVDLNPYTVNAAGQYESGSVVIGKGFKYTIKEVKTPGVNGTFEKTAEGVYTFTPNTELLSGKIYVTLGITPEAGTTVNKNKPIPDVDLVLEFQQSHDSKKMTLERTTYTYAADSMYTDAREAYEKGFAGYASVTAKVDHKNPTQNCNTDIWFYPDTKANRDKYPNAPESFFVHDNTIEVIDGKLYAEESGKYRIYLRGRYNCALYYSTDGGVTYKLGAYIADKGDSANFRPNDENTYFDLELEEDSWIYIKEVLIVQSSCPGGPAKASYIGVGSAQWTVPMYTTTTDEDGTTHYFDGNGKEVTADEANNTDPVPPTNANYANAYRSNFEFVNNSDFKADYFYNRPYTYNYADNVMQSKGQTLVDTNYLNGIGSYDKNKFKKEYLTDGNRNTFIHTNLVKFTDKPLTMTIDLGEEKTVNRMTIYTQNRPNGDWYFPTDFTLEVSRDGENFTKVDDFANLTRSGVAVTVNFKETTFRYYRLTVTGSSGSYANADDRKDRVNERATYLIIGEIEMWDIFEVNNGNQISPDNDMFDFTGNWKSVQAKSTFGHAYLGNDGDVINFTFTGTRLAILNTAAYGRNYKVLIDDKEVKSIDLIEVKGGYGAYYLTDALPDGLHTVKIICTGEACFDSFAIYK